jgi:hypothetical protein
MAEFWETRGEGWSPGHTQAPGTQLLEAASESPTPVRWRELLAVFLLVVLADVTVYRGPGFAGYALGFTVAPLLLALGVPRLRAFAGTWIVGGMLLLLAAKLVWCGNELLVAVGCALLVAQAMTLAGRLPCVLDLAVFALQTPAAGGTGLMQYCQATRKLKGGIPRGGWLGLLLPLVALGVFGTIFVLANPDLMTSVWELLQRGIHALCDWWVRFGPTGMEILFWLAVGWVTIGLLRPVVERSVLARFRKPQSDVPAHETPSATPLYTALRNMLVAVIVLFAVYLAFEFKTLWFRAFPKGFYYAGYAHEGAA